MKPCIGFVAAIVAAAGLAVQAAPSSPGFALKGEILEVRNVPSYTYLRLKTNEGERWAAVPTASVKKGDRVTLYNAMVMENFESKALKRKFARIVFATLTDPNAAAPGTASPPHGAPLAAPPLAVKVPKATGPDAKTVAEVVAGRSALKGKIVTVRARVMKVSSGILGKNWLHLQDGSGSAAAGTHDLIVTTTQPAAAGEVVSATGTVRTDVDLGSGYVYAVLLDGAKLRK